MYMRAEVYLVVMELERTCMHAHTGVLLLMCVCVHVYAQVPTSLWDEINTRVGRAAYHPSPCPCTPAPGAQQPKTGRPRLVPILPLLLFGRCSGPLPPERARRLLGQMLAAVAHCHERRVRPPVRRDLP